MAAASMANDGRNLPMTKSEKAKKAEVVKEIHQIKIKLQTADREKATRLYSKQSDFHRDFRELEDLDSKAAEELKMEKGRVVQQISKIKNQVQSFRRELQNVRPTPEFVEKLKVIMEDIEAQIAEFKGKQQLKYEELLNEERITNQEVLALEKRFESWANAPAIVIPKKTRPASAPLNSHRDITKDLPPEVATFERFVQQTGGPRGGWDEYDQGTFMKYRNRHKGKMGFLLEAARSLPTKTEEEVRDHEKWYREYLRLNDLKKEAIHKWKEQKELEKVETAIVVEEIDREEEEKKLREEERKKLFEQERIQRKYQLNAWKVEKELERAAEEERKARQEVEKARKADRERQRQEEVKKQVLAIKAERDVEEKERRFEERLIKQIAAEARRKENQEDLARFQQRDLQRVKSRVQVKREKEEAAEREKQRRLEVLRSQVNVHVERDPSRLLRPTKGWEERKKDQTSSGGQVLHMPHRAVPGWRAGLS